MAGLDDTDQEEASVGNHLGKMRQRMGAARAAEEDTDEVSVEKPEMDEDEEEEAAEVQQQTRRDKRASRQTARERAAAAEARAEAYKEQLERFGQQRQQPTQQAPVTADVDKRIRSNFAELEKLETDFVAAQRNRTLTPEMERTMRERAQELDVERMELASERRELQVAPQRRQQELWRQLENENSDVYHNRQARDYAMGRAMQLLAQGRANDKALHDEVMEEARTVILGKRPKPDAIERQRATGMSAGPRGLPAPAKTTISMPKGSHYYKMATAMYPDLDPAQACQKWAQGPGKKLKALGG